MFSRPVAAAVHLGNFPEVDVAVALLAFGFREQSPLLHCFLDATSVGRRAF